MWKAAGEDEIPAELLKAGIDSIAGRVHQEFRTAQISTLYKQNEDRRNGNNYIGISFFSVTGKLIARLVLPRLQVLVEKLYPESQFGFRAGRSTKDMIFSVRQLQTKF